MFNYKKLSGLFCVLINLMFSSVFFAATASAQQIQPRIVNGDATDITQFPWQVALVRDGTNVWSDFACGGSIIHKKWILTAAHCFDSDKTWSEFVYVGMTNIVTPDQFQIIRIKQVYKHESYNPGTLNNDIALLELSEDIDLVACNDVETRCQIIALTNNTDSADLINPGAEVIISGWGQTSPTDENSIPDVLQSATISTISCVLPGSYASTDITDNMFCAYDASTAAIKDSCLGDSGGPMVADTTSTNDGFTQVGIVSWGFECADANFPGVYTKLGNYGCWIKDTSGGDVNVPNNGVCSGKNGGVAKEDYVYSDGSFGQAPASLLVLMLILFMARRGHHFKQDS